MRRRLAAALLFLAAPLAADANTLFVSKLTPKDGGIVRIEIPSGVATDIVNGLDGPEDGACSPDGFIFFPELDGRINRFRQDGGGKRKIMPEGALHPEGLAFDEAGNLYFNSRVVGTDPHDGAWKIAGGSAFNPPVQVIAPFTRFGEGGEFVRGGPRRGAYLLAELDADRIVISNPPGAAVSTFITNIGLGSPDKVFGIVTDGCGQVFVTMWVDVHHTQTRVWRYDPDGRFIEEYASGPGQWLFLEFDSDGNLYVADYLYDTVWKVAPNRVRTVFAEVEDAGGVAICRDAPDLPCIGLECWAGGPYVVPCAGKETCFPLESLVTQDMAGGPIAYLWKTDCPGAKLSDPTVANPTLCLASTNCPVCNVSLTVTQAGKSTTCSATVAIQDAVPPMMVGVPIDLAASCAAVPAAATVTATDDCSPPPVVTFLETRVDGSCADRYQLLRTWTATDACGNTTTATQTVTVDDTTAPKVAARLVPATPRPPSSAASACSPPTLRRFRVECDRPVDDCDPNPIMGTELIALQHDVPSPGVCVPRIDRTAVACDEVVEIELRAPACPRQPRSPQPAETSSSGFRVIRGERVTLEAVASDRCGNVGLFEYDPSLEPSPSCDERTTAGDCCPAIAAPVVQDCPGGSC